MCIVFSPCVCMCNTRVPGTYGGQGKIPWNWIYEWFWATVWVLRTEPGSSAGRSCSEPSSLQPLDWTSKSWWTSTRQDRNGIKLNGLVSSRRQEQSWGEFLLGFRKQVLFCLFFKLLFNYDISPFPFLPLSSPITLHSPSHSWFPFPKLLLYAYR